MIVTQEQARKIVSGCKLVATVRSNGYGGKMADVQHYTGRHGAGYTVESERVTRYYVYPYTLISRDVYEGGYDLRAAARKTEQLPLVSYDGVAVEPNWRLIMHTCTGSVTVDRVEVQGQTTIAGTSLVTWFKGKMNVKAMRTKIRRAMKRAVDSGKAIID